MRRLMTAAGVDYGQWKALTIVALKLDYRQMSFGQAQWGGRDAKGVGVIVAQLVFYTMFGLFMAAAVWFIPDLFLKSTLLMTVTVFVVGTTILLEHNSALTSPVDYPVLGYRPVSSRTYFAAKLTNVLVYTIAITTVATYLPIIALLFRHGAAIGLAGMAAVYMCSATVALGVLVAYATMLTVFGPRGLTRALSYIQLAMSFMVYGGYFVFARFFQDSALRSFVVVKTPLVLLFPGTWYASYVELAAGRTGLMEWIPAALTVVLAGALAAGLGSRLSLDYSERLGALTSVAAPRGTTAAGAPATPRWARRLFRSGEARAMALLIRSQFTNDQRFRLAVLSIIPLTLLYILMGVQDGGLGDPFDRSADRSGLSLVTVAVLMFPSMLKMSVTHSDTFRASWVFFASPADRMQLVRSAKNVLVAFFLLPYLLFVLAVYLYYVRSPLHVAIHLTLLGLVSHFCLQFMVFLDPELPFSKPPMKGRAPMTMFAVIFTVMLIAGLFQALAPRMYQSLPLTVAGFGTVLGASALADLLTRARVERQMRSAEFEG